MKQLKERLQPYLDLLDSFEYDVKNPSELKELLEECNNLYYNGESPLTDDEFDGLVQIYKGIRNIDPLNFMTKPSSKGKKVKQDLNQFLCTLEKVYNINELGEWLDKTCHAGNVHGVIPVYGSYKYDGCSIAVKFQGEKVVEAFSRGQDGEGTDYSQWFTGKRYRGVVDNTYKFEAVMLWADFDKFSEEYLKETGSSPSNPRNSVSGILNGNKTPLTQKWFDKYVSFVPIEGYQLSVQTKHNGSLYSMFNGSGLKVVPFTCVKFLYDADSKKFTIDEEDEAYGRFDNPIRFYNSIHATRDSLAVMIDGLVYDLMDPVLRSTLGYKEVDGKPCPRFSVALKFPYKSKKTILTGIEYDVANNVSGRITPCVTFEPVKIDGRVFKRVSISNFDRFIKEKFFKDEEVILTIRGDVLGYVSKCEESTHNDKVSPKKYFKLPTKCPICGGELVLSENQTWMNCINPKCFRKKTGSIINFLDKMRIKDIGENTIDFMVKKGYISNIVDLYRFDDESLMKEPGFGEKSVQVIQNALEARKEVFDYEFFGALGWEGLSRGIMKKLFEVMTYQELLKLFNEKLKKQFVTTISSTIEGFSTILSESLHSGLTQLTSEGEEEDSPLFLLDTETITIKNSKLDGVTEGQRLKVVVTGDLNKYSRETFKELIEAKGHRLISAISSKTDYLITNFPNSGTIKLKKAKELGIPIIGETEAYELLGL